MVLYGLTADDIAKDADMPNVAKRLDMVDLNAFHTYLAQLRKRAGG
jgi:hypothetical protein